MKNFTILTMITLMLPLKACGESSNSDKGKNNAEKPNTINEAIGETKLKITKWPTDAKIRETILKSKKGYESIRTLTDHWMKKIIDSRHLPSSKERRLLLHNEFNGYDVVRMKWVAGKYNFENSQTRSYFYLKVTENRAINLKGKEEKVEYSKKICREVINKTGYRRGPSKTTPPIPTVVSGLREKIILRNFSKEKTIEFIDNKTVFGKYLDFTDLGIKHRFSQSLNRH